MSRCFFKKIAFKSTANIVFLVYKHLMLLLVVRMEYGSRLVVNNLGPRTVIMSLSCPVPMLRQSNYSISDVQGFVKLVGNDQDRIGRRQLFGVREVVGRRQPHQIDV